MEDNTISMFMDVKLDIRERKLEFSHMKSWSRYFVRVEAVKCFPCYMRISFFSSPTDLATDLIVRINIPGLTVQMATSRTKQHSYGLFWKNNRKRCCAYFALETQLLCERHLRWMKKSIRNLELYRQEMMQLRRASRTPLYEIRQEMQPLDPLGMAASPVTWDDMGIYQNLDNTQNIMGLQDMLGPLPTVPHVTERGETTGAGVSAVNISRRVSGMSGIYEEIRDSSVAVNSRLSRASIASGIYEEMKLVVDAKDDGSSKAGTIDENSFGSPPPPPLPPRPRSNTNEDFDLQRSFTTPEVDLMKKKRHWLRLDTMFGRRRTTSTDSQGSGTGKKHNSSPKDGKGHAKRSSGKRIPETVANNAPTAVVHRDKVCRMRLTENKRNSFSSPDLSRLKVNDSLSDLADERMGNESLENLSDGNGSCTSEFYPQQYDIDYIEEDFVSSEFINMSTASSLVAATSEEFDQRQGDEELLDPLRDFRRLNISERIFDGFNRSMNSSKVNLVGAACNSSTIKETIEPSEEGTGTAQARLNLTAAPLSDADMVGYLEMGPAGTGFNRQKLNEVIYRNQPPRSVAEYRVDLAPKETDESIYMSMDGTAGKLPEPIRSSSTSSSSSGVSSASEHSTLTECSAKHRNSVDDKIPSYYPNEEFVRTPIRRATEGKRSPGQTKTDKMGTTVTTPVATTLPRVVRSAQRAPVEAKTEIHDRIDATFRTPKATNRRACPRAFLQIPESQPTAINSSPLISGSHESSPKLFQKYATLARITSPNKYSTRSNPPNPVGRQEPGSPAVDDESSRAPTTVPVGSGRRFGSLPRFGKIDLSPLRMKINSVLQRHNSGNL